jgi:2-polyprenyl-3-methyl-5-hydroxy-6-metoxy-1,4-benzoquinol methylase
MAEIIDWTKLESIPAGKKTEEKILKHLESIKKIIKDGGVRTKIVEECNGKTVLDIGALEHGWDNISKKEGLFFRIHEVAKKVTGLDIIKKDVDKMVSNGYDFVCMDATSEKYLGKKFDIVNVGDVIEHVDNPVALLKFCKRHLKENGKILITTPNPYSISTLLNLFKSNEQIVNFQHISWITPSMALEMGRRAGLAMSEYCVAEPSTKYKRALLFWLPFKFKAGVFMFVFSHPTKK